MILTRSKSFYIVLVLVWMLILTWLALEHRRVRGTARSALVYRARDISTSLSVVIRSQRMFFGLVTQSRLESALAELIKSDELLGVELYSTDGNIVASAGEKMELDLGEMTAAGVSWGGDSVVVFNLVDLGSGSFDEGPDSRPTIIIPNNPFEDRGERPDRGDRGDRRMRPPWPLFDNEVQAEIHEELRQTRPGTEDGRPWMEGGDRRPPDYRREDGEPPPETSFRGPRFRRPRWMNEDDFKDLIQKQGLHGFAIRMSNQAYSDTVTKDYWMRIAMGGLSLIAMIGFALAWRNLEHSSQLQLRLLRASEMNKHLRAMNVAAAGLAHETRNPLNIIRGLAQIISKEPSSTGQIRDRSLQITNEVDRVAAQLDEFIHFSRPREPRKSTVNLGGLIQDIFRALESDFEEKAIRHSASLEVEEIQADEQLLRQVLFNILINSIEAVPQGGSLQVKSESVNGREVRISIQDNGKGIPKENLEEIFRPYFTTHEKGTGLGLAIVQQIVLSHGWDIECVSEIGKGATMIIKGISPASTSHPS